MAISHNPGPRNHPLSMLGEIRQQSVELVVPTIQLAELRCDHRALRGNITKEQRPLIGFTHRGRIIGMYRVRDVPPVDPESKGHLTQIGGPLHAAHQRHT